MKSAPQYKNGDREHLAPELPEEGRSTAVWHGAAVLRCSDGRTARTTGACDDRRRGSARSRRGILERGARTMAGASQWAGLVGLSGRAERRESWRPLAVIGAGTRGRDLEEAGAPDAWAMRERESKEANGWAMAASWVGGLTGCWIGFVGLTR
jgi:hypothetical protein